jgi:hypothetical protein
MRTMLLIGVIMLTIVGGGASGLAAPGAELFVSPTGNDNHPGTRAQPLASLQGAQAAVRKLKAASGLPAGGVTVWLAGGDYLLAQGLELTAADSGAEGQPVVYRAREGQMPRLLGGQKLPATAWQPVSDAALRNRLPAEARDKVRVLDLQALGVQGADNAWPLRFKGYAGWPELFFGGQRMTMARWPNEGYARIAKVVDVGSKPRWAETPDRGGKFLYEGDRPANWLQAPEVYLKGFWCFKWSDETIKVASIDPKEKLITMAAPHVYGLGGASGNLWFALNLLEELDSPGEYVVDHAAKRLYFWPPAGPADTEVLLSTLSAPFIKTTEVSHVTWQGLTLEAGRGSGFEITGGSSNLIAGCTLRNFAVKGVVVNGGSKHGVVGCDIYQTGQGGISLTGGDRKTLTPAGHYAVNNHIHHFSELVATYTLAISLNGVGNRAAHNLMHDTPHEAMNFSGNDHIVEFNEFHDVCLDTDDGGAIHMGRDWTWRGNVIRYNLFHHIGGGTHVDNMGVYLDDMQCGVQVYGNVLYRIPRANLFGGGRDNIMENNIIVDSKIPVHIDNRAMNWANYHVDTTMKQGLNAVPYKLEPWASRYPALVNIWEDEPAVPKGNVVRRNLMVRCGEMHLAPEARKYGTFEHNLRLDEDPGFVDPQRLDFRLKDDSRVYREIPGFEKLPLEKIGLYRDEYRLELPVRTPLVNPASQSFVEEMTVTLATAARSPEARIHFTLDGSEPTVASPVYRAPLKLTQSCTLKAVAYPLSGASRGRSSVATAHYVARKLGPEGGIYLSDLPGTDIIAHGGLRQDRNYAGDGPLRLGGKSFEKGLLLCPAATDQGGRGQVTYVLSGGLEKVRTLQATIGVDEAMQERGSVTFAVEVLRGDKWERIFESPVMKGGQSQALELDLSGAKQLRLLTTDAGDNIHADHAAWAGAILR